MARIFSWYIQDKSKECFSYLAQSGSSGDYDTGYMVLDNKIESSETLKKIADVVSRYTELEYQTQFNKMKTKVAEKGLKPDWKHYTYYYNVNGNNLIMLTGNGEIGPQGPKGPQGPQGIQGEKGETGSAGNGRNIMCYCSLPEGYKPTRANLAGGKFYPNKWGITYPTDPVGINGDKGRVDCSWGDSNEPDDPTYKVWMTNADFPSSTGDSPSEAVTPIVKIDIQGQKYTWATPIQISGPKGDNGADGDAIEFIYFRTTGEKPDTPKEISQKPDFCPEAYINGVDTGRKWEDHPEGIDKEWKYEWMSQRKKDSTTGLWGSFSPVVQWSRWGEDGIDGDGVEYIFASAATLDDGPTLFTKVPKQESFTEKIWQTPEIWDYIKEQHMESTYAPWTDDPSDVSPDEPYEFVSIRRRKYDDTEGNAVFGPFEEPTLWARWSDDGDSILTSFSFATLSAGTDISDCKVSGFTVTNDSINPKWTKRGGTILSGINWEDAPHQEDSSQIIWMVSGVFKKHVNAKTGAVTIDQTQAWSPIQQMVDTADFEAIYTANETPENPNTIPNFRKDGVGIDPTWLAAANQIGWYDEVYEVPGGKAIWMATIKGHSNIWDKDANSNDNWQIMKVKGEKGDSGSTGVSKFKSIVFKRATTKPDKPVDSAGSYASPVPSGWYDTIPSGTGEVWTTSRTFASDGSNDAHWSDVISCIDTEYVDYEWTRHWATIEDADSHKPLKSTPDQSLTPAQNNQWYDSPISGATFMAVRQVDNGVYKGNWEVSQIKGEKGDDGAIGTSKFKSIVYKRASSQPSKPTDSEGSFTSPVPSGWSDSAPGGTGEVWMTSRTFGSDGSKDAHWADVVSCIDNKYMDYEWNKYYTTWDEIRQHAPTKQKPGDSYSGEDANHWYDSPIQGAIWMAVRQVDNGAYADGSSWEISKVKGEDGSSQTDLEYLKNIFPNVDASADTATLRGFLGVMSGNSNNSDVVAFLNGSSGITDQDHGTLMIAAGVESLNQANMAKFRVYEDGTVCAKDAEIDGSVTASTGYIGGISINGNGIGITNGDNGFFFGSDGSISINNKNVQITNEGIFFKNDTGDNVLSVVNKAYHSLSAFTDTMAGGSATIRGSVNEIIDSNNIEHATTISKMADIPLTFRGTTFTVPDGYTNKVTVTINDAIEGGLLVRETSGVDFGSGTVTYMGRVSLVNEDNISQGDVIRFPQTTVSAAHCTLKTGRVSKTFTVGPGTYHLALIEGMFIATGTANGTIPDQGYHWEFHLALVNGGGSGILIDSHPSNSGVEIFRNGFAIKNSSTNYVFAAAPDDGEPESLIFAIKSNNKGVYLSGGTSTWQTLK